MDLLDTITSGMDKERGKVIPKPKPAAAASSSFRIPKKTAPAVSAASPSVPVQGAEKRRLPPQPDHLSKRPAPGASGASRPSPPAIENRAPRDGHTHHSQHTRDDRREQTGSQGPGGFGQPRPTNAWDRGAPVSRDVKYERGAKHEPMDTSGPSSSTTTTSNMRLNLGRNVDVCVNNYRIDMSRCATQISKYQVETVYLLRIPGRDGQPEKMKEKNAVAGPRHSLGQQLRRRAIHSCLQVVIQRERDVFGGDEYAHVSDRGNCLFSKSCAIREGDGKKVFTVLPSELPRDVIDYWGGSRLDRAEVSFQYTISLNPRADCAISSTQEIQQFLEILTSQMLYKMNNHTQNKNSFYERDSRHDTPISGGGGGGGRGGRGGFGGGGRGGYHGGGGRGDRDGGRGGGGGGETGSKVVKMGFEKSVRYVEGRDGKLEPQLNVDCRKSPFFSDLPLLDFLKAECGARDSRDVEDMLKDRKKSKKIVKLLRGVVVIATHLDCKFFAIHGIHHKSAKEEYLQRPDMETISVEKYFEITHQKRLRYPHIPLITEKRSAGYDCYYPIEMLRVAPGQLVPNSALSGQEQERMITITRQPPQKMMQDIQHMIDSACLRGNENPWLAAFGIGVDTQPVVVRASLIPAPHIEYGRGEKMSASNWRPRGHEQFFIPGEIRRMVFIVFDQCVDPRQAGEFVRSLLEGADKRGIAGCRDARAVQVVDCASEDHAGLSRRFEEWRSSGVNLVMGVTQDKKDDVHHDMKYCEQIGVATQHISKDTFNKIAQRQGGATTLDGVLMKLNEKLGGINIAVAPNSEWIGRGEDLKKLREWFFADYMYVGLAVSHPGPQHRYDKETGAGEEPSTVGLSYSVRCASDFASSMWLQSPRQQLVDSLVSKFRDALLSFHSRNKRMPKRIVVYRGGLSEGEMDKARGERVHMECAIREAAAQVHPDKCAPALTVIAVLMHGGVRMVPAEAPRPGAKPFEQNCQPGTCIDRGAVDPRRVEWLMTSQKGIQGTSKTSHYVILSDDSRQPIDATQIKMVSHALCFTLGVVAGSTRIPGVLMSAQQVAERARDQINYHNTRDDMSMMSGSSCGGRFRSDGSADFFEKATIDSLSHQLANKCNFTA